MGFFIRSCHCLTGVLLPPSSRFVSPLQVSAEMAAIKHQQQQQPDLDTLTIAVRPAAREVAATYVVDEMSIELVVALPVNHPLGVISVETGRRIGVANTQWRNWMLQMVTFLNHQVGNLGHCCLLLLNICPCLRTYLIL